MLNVKKLQIIATLTMLMVTFIFARGLAQQTTVSKLNKGADTSKYQQTPDKALVGKFEMLCKKMTNIKGNYTVAGIINMSDKARPADKMENIRFLFCKKGDEFYYRLGSSATVNEQGVYLYIDYKTKRVMLSQKKQVGYDAGLKQFGDIGANIKSENYKLSSKTTGNDQTISLINEYHISCKLYAITFDRHTMKIKHLHMRLSNFNEPLRTDNEKIVDVSISQWSNTADMTKYLTKSKVVRNENGKWKTVNEFKNYQLIKM
jgi:hypothetical protein